MAVYSQGLLDSEETKQIAPFDARNGAPLYRAIPASLAVSVHVEPKPQGMRGIT
jgi:hypothetical protein